LAEIAQELLRKVDVLLFALYIEASPDCHMPPHVLQVLPDKRRGDDDDGGKVEKPFLITALQHLADGSNPLAGPAAKQ